MRLPRKRPTIVCLCGSTKFADAFKQANLEETLAGRIVLSVGAFAHADGLFGTVITPDMKVELDQLHLDKIDLAEEVLILNVNGYIGESTARELAYAVFSHKVIRFLNKELGDEYMIRERHLLGRHVAAFMDQNVGALP